MLGGVVGEEGGAGEPGGGGEAATGELGDGGAGGGERFFENGAAEVDRAETGGGVFDGGREREGEGEKNGAGLGLGGRVGGADQQRGAACEGLGSGQAEFDAGGAGGGRGGAHEGFFAMLREEGGGAIRDVGLGAEDGVEREIGEMEDGEHAERSGRDAAEGTSDKEQGPRDDDQ